MPKTLQHLLKGDVKLPKPLKPFCSPYSTPAARPSGGTLERTGGPCLSAASWAALLRLASSQSDEAGLGVNGFGSFCRNKRSSAAGPKPGIYRIFTSFLASKMWVEAGIALFRTQRKFIGMIIRTDPGTDILKRKETILPRRIRLGSGRERRGRGRASGENDFFQRAPGVTAGICLKSFRETGIGIGVALLLCGTLAQTS